MLAHREEEIWNLVLRTSGSLSLLLLPVHQGASLPATQTKLSSVIILDLVPGRLLLLVEAE